MLKQTDNKSSCLVLTRVTQSVNKDGVLYAFGLTRVSFVFLLFQMTRMNSEFEQKLWELKNELESQRLQQVGTMKNVLERQHSKDMLEIDDVHQQQMEELREGKIMENVWTS